MSTTVNVQGQFDAVRFVTVRDGNVNVIWIRTDRETVALNLKDEQLEDLGRHIDHLRAKAIAS